MSGIASLWPPLIPYAQELVRRLQQAGYRPIVTSGRRTHAEQVRLYQAWLARGRTGLPAAYPGTSKHERGLAFDLVTDPREGLAAAGQLWESWGGRWGGRFQDDVHFEV